MKKVTKIAGLVAVILIYGMAQGFTELSKKPINKTVSYHQEMLQLQKAIQQYFYDPSAGFYKETAVVEEGKNPYSYLWPLCGMIQANNEIEKVMDTSGLVQNTLHIIQAYYDPAPPAPGYASYIMKLKGGDRFYDDNQWIGIACMDAYSREKNPAYLNTGKMIYRYMMTGYDTVLGGGIYWQENRKISKNTCSNGPAIILSLQLYKATNDKKYLDTALMIYNWVNKNLKAPSGLYYDNIKVGSHRIDSAMYSYNTGTLLQSNVYLYEITKDNQYLKRAISIADSSLPYFYGNGRFRDSYWFNAVLLRGYQHLLQYHNDKKYMEAFRQCLNYALANNKSEQGLMMRKDKVQDLVAQSGMLEILARFTYLERKHLL